ncbi:MAG: transglutaminase domain-containing protein, partial [Chloroflexales bacterium]|nr:transglutaminase domain-containing protein [Chloroflexales bacterium]
MAPGAAARPRAARTLGGELAAVLPGALLILLMTGAVVWSLSVSSWASGLDVLRPMALLGLLVGIIFARLPWLPGWLAHLLSAALALTWAVQLLGDQMDGRLLTWRDQATDLIIRVIMWARVLGSGGRGEDILLFVLVLCLLVWALAYSTAWMTLRRGLTWRPIILNAVVALVNYTYVLPKPTAAFFVFLCAALLLLVYQHVLERQAAWDARHVEYPDLLAVRFLWSAALVCGLLIALTAILPGQVSIDRATRTWALLSGPFKAAREGWEDMFSTISAPPGAGSGAFTSRGATFGGARKLTADVVMEVRSTGYDYWRAVAFDKYTGQGWQNTVGEQARAALGVGTPEQARTPRAPDEPIPVSETLGRREIAQRFTLAADRPDDLVMVGGTARSVSVPTLVEHNYLDAASGQAPNFDETALIVARERLREGQTYTVTALMSFADVASLRAAGGEYPQWVRERYLQLPDIVTPRTRELAAQVVAAAGADNPYDIAVAIQGYLRTLTYNETVPSPPAGSDPVDWFLFQQREGYCDYFASAMVVMLRAQGVPARWARGYAGGEFDAERGVYVVRENVAH